MWEHVRSWFSANAEHVHVEFLPRPDQLPIEPYDGYLQLFLAEGFLARAVTWGNRHFPALHGGLRMTFGNESGTPFTAFTGSPEVAAVPGAQLDRPITPLVPYQGGVVEIEGALYRATKAGPLACAVDLVGTLASLVGPPLAQAAELTRRIGDGLAAVLQATGDQPMLAVHWSATAPGGGGNPVRSGHLVVVNAPSARLPGPLRIDGGLLHAGDRRLTGADYLVLRLDGWRERPDWRLPQLDALIRAAHQAYRDGPKRFRAKRDEAIDHAWQSTDLTPGDQPRVAELVARAVDAIQRQGAVPEADLTFAELAATELCATTDPRLTDLTLEDLLT